MQNGTQNDQRNNNNIMAPTATR